MTPGSKERRNAANNGYKVNERIVEESQLIHRNNNDSMLHTDRDVGFDWNN